MVKTSRDESTVGTEHWLSEDWKQQGHVADSSLKPDLVWLGREAGGQWEMVVVNVKVTSTDDLNKAFKEKDDKNPELATKETGSIK